MAWMFMIFFLMAGVAASHEDYDQVPTMCTLAIICLLMETFGAPADVPTDTGNQHNIAGVLPPLPGIQPEQEGMESREPVSQPREAEPAEGNPVTLAQQHNEPEPTDRQDQAITAGAQARDGEATVENQVSADQEQAAVETQASSDQEQAAVGHQAFADQEQAAVGHQAFADQAQAAVGHQAASTDQSQPDIPYGVQETSPESSLDEYFARLLGVDRILSTAANNRPSPDTDPVSVHRRQTTGNHSLATDIPAANLLTCCGIPTPGLPSCNLAISVGTQTPDQPLTMSEVTSATQTPTTTSEMSTMIQTRVKILSKKDYKKLKDRLKKAEGGHLCLICMVEPRMILFRPCHHLAVCCPCSDQIKRGNGKCCMCRTPIEEYLKIYSP